MPTETDIDTNPYEVLFLQGVDVDDEYRMVHRSGCVLRMGARVRPACVEDLCGLGLCNVCMPGKYMGLQMRVHRQYRAKEHMLLQWKNHLEVWFKGMLRDAGVKLMDKPLQGDDVHDVQLQIQMQPETATPSPPPCPPPAPPTRLPVLDLDNNCVSLPENFARGCALQDQPRPLPNSPAASPSPSPPECRKKRPYAKSGRRQKKGKERLVEETAKKDDDDDDDGEGGALNKLPKKEPPRMCVRGRNIRITQPRKNQRLLHMFIRNTTVTSTTTTSCSSTSVEMVASRED